MVQEQRVEGSHGVCHRRRRAGYGNQDAEGDGLPIGVEAMKTVILAGGRGTRLQELTGEIPKPMVRVGGKPMLEHIMGIYSRFGFDDFLIAGGYRQEVIADWLSTAYLPWRAELVDTGLDTSTGGRIKRLERRLSERFMLTYGDGVSDIDLSRLLNFHDRHQSLVTVTAVHPPPRFGQLSIIGDYVDCFVEKPIESAWIN